MTMAGHMIKRKVTIRTIRISVVETTLEMIRIEINKIKMIEETSWKETGHITQAEVGIEIIVKT